MGEEMLSAFIVASATLVGVIIGSLGSYFIARLQFKASVISANRQNWINTLRDCIAEFQVKAKVVTVETKLSSQDSTSFASDPKNFDQAVEKKRVLRNKIALLINPNEQDHDDLIKLMAKVEDLCINEDSIDDEKHDNLQKEITSLAQKILNREWERVKKGK
jgi:hypothetical protein